MIPWPFKDKAISLDNKATTQIPPAQRYQTLYRYPEARPVIVATSSCYAKRVTMVARHLFIPKYTNDGSNMLNLYKSRHPGPCLAAERLTKLRAKCLNTASTTKGHLETSCLQNLTSTSYCTLHYH